MKLLHTADLHLGMSNYSKLDPQTGLDSRLLDFLKTFDFIIDLALKERVDAFLFAGDAYKSRDPSPTQQRGFGERIKKLAKAGIPTVLIIGNHDTPNAEGKANTLDIYSALEIEHVWVSRRPELLQIPTKSGNLQIITAPWVPSQNLKNYGEKLVALYEKINPANGPAVLVGHLEVEGASYGSEKGLVLTNDVTIPLPLLASPKLSYVALGHIHKHQVLGNPASAGPLIVYSGSPERIDFGEAQEEKGVVLIKLPVTHDSGLTTHYQFIPTPARKFIHLEVDLKADDPDPTQTILKEIKKHEIKEAILRIIINIPASFNKEIDMDQIKKALGETFYLASISKNIERVDRPRLEGTEEVERLTPMEALEKYFESKKFNPERIKNLKKFAESLFE